VCTCNREIYEGPKCNCVSDKERNRERRSLPSRLFPKIPHGTGARFGDGGGDSDGGASRREGAPVRAAHLGEQPAGGAGAARELEGAVAREQTCRPERRRVAGAAARPRWRAAGTVARCLRRSSDVRRSRGGAATLQQEPRRSKAQAEEQRRELVRSCE
jgi:hypothetical protein